ncbi:MAG: nuclear transport factor 2 family protein [Streptosporangiaceae bacterium]
MSSTSQLSTDGAGVTGGAGAEEVVDRFNAAWGAHDLAAALALISDDCVFESTSPPDGQRYVGRAAISAAWQPIFEDQASRFTVEDSFSAGARVVQRWRYDWDGGHVRGIDVFTVQDGLITEKTAYVKG